MPNHVHFIAIPQELSSLAMTFKNAHMLYAQYVNKNTGRKGHLWQGRFYSCILDLSYLILAARYIERNPVRADLVKKPWSWPWSSAMAHIKGKDDGVIRGEDLLKMVGMLPGEWKKYIYSEEEPTILERIRKYTHTGRPLAENVKKENTGAIRENRDRPLL